MKKFILCFGVAVFMIALFVNVSISANKKAVGTTLLGFSSEASANCEAPSPYRDDMHCVWLYDVCIMGLPDGMFKLPCE